jgi:hypothetical protein
MNSFPKSDVLKACETYGPQLHVPEGLDGRGVMAALASNESSLGFNCGPRYEASYDVGGKFSHGKGHQLLLDKYGRDACCSYGPWQMMFDNFATADPEILKTSLDTCAHEFVTWFNKYVIAIRHAKDLPEIGEVWNLGHIGDDPVYVTKLLLAYGKWKGGTI